MLCWPCWDNIAKEYCLVNVVQICLRKHDTRKVLVQCWHRAHSLHFAGTLVVVSNMSGSLFHKWVQPWLFLFSVGLGVDLCRKGQHWMGTNIDWNNYIVCYSTSWGTGETGESLNLKETCNFYLCATPKNHWC